MAGQGRTDSHGIRHLPRRGEQEVWAGRDMEH